MILVKEHKKIWINLFLGAFDSSFDKTDRKISAHATLQTPPVRTSFLSDDKKHIPKPIPEEEIEHPRTPSSSSPVIHSKSKFFDFLKFSKF